jgi:hypothetical protein
MMNGAPLSRGKGAEIGRNLAPATDALAATVRASGSFDEIPSAPMLVLTIALASQEEVVESGQARARIANAATVTATKKVGLIDWPEKDYGACLLAIRSTR